MTVTCLLKSFIVLCVLHVSLAISVDADSTKDRSKFKYGYVISHDEGSTQAHLESRDGNLALGRYYVNLPNGNGQKVTYFADDLGFHTGVTYSSQNGKGSSKTHIAMGHKALAAFGNSFQDSSTLSPLFGSKILKTIAGTSSTKPADLPKLNYTPVPGGFYLTHSSLDVQNSTEQPVYVSSLTPQSLSTYKDTEGKYSEGVLQSKANTQTFYPTSENVKNEIKQLHIQSTTPSIKSYTSVPQQSLAFSGSSDETKGGRTVKLSSFITNPNGLSYSEEKSIEKTNFADIDAQIISEVQKHAEQIILKDLQKGQAGTQFTPEAQQLTTVTMQPIVVTDGGEISISHISSTTAASEVKKAGKDLQSGSINAVRLTGKNTNDQVLEDSGYFRVSLSPSLTSSINVSPAPQQLIDAKSTDPNNSTFSQPDLCGNGNTQVFSTNPVNRKEGTEAKEPLESGSVTAKVTHTFYPKNEISDERHYVTTIDVQKGISLDVHQNEDGSIQLAQNFPFNKIKSNQVVYNSPTPQPQVVSVTPVTFGQQQSVNSYTPQQPYVLNTVSPAPGLFDVTQNQNVGILQGFNDVSGNSEQYAPEVQDRIEHNRITYESQLVPPAPPVALDDLGQVQNNIQELRQQILSSIDAQHEEEQNKQNLIDEERRQYLENLKKVEALNGQSSITYNLTPQAPVVKTHSVQIVPQYVPQSYQTEVNQVPVTYTEPPQTPSPEAYTKQVSYSQEIQNPTEQRPWNYELQTVNGYAQQAVSNNLQQVVSAYGNPGQQTVATYDGNRQEIAVLSDNNIQQTAPALQLEPRYSQVTAQPEAKQPISLVSSNPVVTQQDKVVAKTLLVNPIVPFDYAAALQVKQQPIPLLQTYSLPVKTESPIALQAIYQIPYSVPVSMPISQSYKLIPFTGVSSVSNKRYHSTLTKKPTNKLRVQPLKPSIPDEDSQREALQNLLAQPQFQRTYIHPGFTVDSRLQLRQIRKNQISNSDQVRSQSLTRRGKSLKNLRIEYGFKPPLRPSVEFSEEVKPSIYGSSVQPH